MNPSDAVVLVMALFSEEYPSKFTSTTERVKIWGEMLRGFPADIILAAGKHLVSTEEWPPNVAKVRSQCVLFASGDLVAPTGLEAWGNVWSKYEANFNCDPSVDYGFTELEEVVVKQMGGLAYLARSTNQATDRAHFAKAFDALVRKRTTESATLPEVLDVVQRYTALPPAPATPLLTTPTSTTDADAAVGPTRVQVQRCECGEFYMGECPCPRCGADRGEEA